MTHAVAFEKANHRLNLADEKSSRKKFKQLVLTIVKICLAEGICQSVSIKFCLIINILYNYAGGVLGDSEGLGVPNLLT